MLRLMQSRKSGEPITQREPEGPHHARFGSRAPSNSAALAAISLLSDKQASIAKQCRKQILAWGDSMRDLLEQTIREGEPSLRRPAREMLQTVRGMGYRLDAGP